MTSSPAMFPLQEHLGMTLETLEPGHAVARVDVRDELRNPNGVLHGAVLFAMVDTCMGAATMSVLDESKFCASIEVHLRFLRPIGDGTVVADTTVVHPGKRIVQLESTVRDAQGRVAATATGSFAVLAL